MPHPFQILSQSDYLIQIADINSYTEWQIVQIQISWLLQKPTDLDLHCLQWQDIYRFSRTRVKTFSTSPLMLNILGKMFSRCHIEIFFLIFPEGWEDILFLGWIRLALTSALASALA